MNVDYTQMAILCGVWVLAITGLVEVIKLGGFNRTRWLPLVSAGIGALSGTFYAPKVLILLGVPIGWWEGAFFGVGAGAHASWVYSLIRAWLKRKSEGNA